jgi:hypothetical protein
VDCLKYLLHYTSRESDIERNVKVKEFGAPRATKGGNCMGVTITMTDDSPSTPIGSS